MNPEERGLLDDILANPGDDAPRLIYADWCEDNGRAERAEFIRVQCELAKRPDHQPCMCTSLGGGEHQRWCPHASGPHVEQANARLSLLRFQERELLAHLALVFSQPFGTRCVMCVDQTLEATRGTSLPLLVFRRGFVAEVRCPLGAWVERDHGRALCREHPVERVRITDAEPLGSGTDFPPGVPADEFWVWVQQCGDRSLEWEVPAELYTPEVRDTHKSRQAALDALDAAALERARLAVAMP